ncbi:MAG TPA: ABC transporter permease [Candidatus Limnocylindrales bacterium]|nr:ABC transporter permease [Candidatus Limnocylindrales bacterium]
MTGQGSAPDLGAPVGGSPPARREPVFPNTRYVARREYRELTSSRIFHVSTITLTILAVIVAFLPIAVRLVERGATTRVAVVASTPELARSTQSLLQQLLNSQGGTRYDVTIQTDEAATVRDVDDHLVDAAVVATRLPDGALGFSVHAGETVGDQTVQLLNVGALSVSFFDFAQRNPVNGFRMPTFDVMRDAGDGGGGAASPYDPSAYASRLIVGAVFGVLIFITIVIYGMWVASGVVAEKASRVMELLVSAASPRQLVLGKAIGIGLAGATQVAIVLTPAIALLLVEGRIADAVLGPSAGIAPSLSALSPTLLGAFALFYVLGFALYSLIYAAAGSLVSRPEDLQIIALPLSLIAITGYLQAILALTGGITWFIRLASFVPFWSPFVMLTRLSVGRVQPIEIVVSVAILVVTIAVTAVIAIRIYAAGVLLYGQRPGIRAYVAAARRG